MNEFQVIDRVCKKLEDNSNTLFLLIAKIKETQSQILGKNVQGRHSIKMKQNKIWLDFENLEFFLKVYFFGVCYTKGCWSL